MCTHRPWAALPRCTASAVVGFALLVCTVAPPLRAQVDEPSGRVPRSRTLAIAGTLAGGLIGLGFSVASDQRGHGRCGAVPCGVFAWAAAGGVVGYFIGRQYDRNFAMYYRGTRPLRPPSTSVALDGTPTALAVRDSLVAVAGRAGIQTFQSAEALTSYQHRGGGLRGVDVLDIVPGSDGLALGSPAGLYLFPPRQGRGTLIRAGVVGAAAASRDRVYFGVGDRLETAPITADSVRPWPGITLRMPLRGAVLDTVRSVLWGITDRALVAIRVRGDSLARISETPLAGGASQLAVHGNRAAIALGERGVLLFDVADPAAPRELARWTTARFSYAVSLDSTRLFVAAGPEGVYVVDVSGPTPRTIGLARSLGFATALVSRGGRTYILDRRENTLRRIPSDF